MSRFKGIWIPKELWFNTELNIIEKAILIEIESLEDGEGCKENDKYFADMLKVNRKDIEASIKRLILKGYLKLDLDLVKDIRVLNLNKDEGLKTNTVKVAAVKKSDEFLNNEILYKHDLDKIMEAWNKLGLKKLMSIEGNRKTLLKARIKTYGLSKVYEAINVINKSNFLMGSNPKGWVITFDWFIRPNNFIKVLEGNYIDKERKEVNGGLKRTDRSVTEEKCPYNFSEYEG